MLLHIFVKLGALHYYNTMLRHTKYLYKYKICNKHLMGYSELCEKYIHFKDR